MSGNTAKAILELVRNAAAEARSDIHIVVSADRAEILKPTSK